MILYRDLCTPELIVSTMMPSLLRLLDDVERKKLFYSGNFRIVGLVFSCLLGRMPYSGVFLVSSDFQCSKYQKSLPYNKSLQLNLYISSEGGIDSLQHLIHDKQTRSHVLQLYQLLISGQLGPADLVTISECAFSSLCATIMRPPVCQLVEHLQVSE